MDDFLFLSWFFKNHIGNNKAKSEHALERFNRETEQSIYNVINSGLMTADQILNVLDKEISVYLFLQWYFGDVLQAALKADTALDKHVFLAGQVNAYNAANDTPIDINDIKPRLLGFRHD